MKSGNIIFRLRGLWFGLVFWVGFSLYAIDHRTVINELGGVAYAHLGWNRELTIQALLALMGACAVAAAAIRTWASAYLSASVVHDARLHSDRLVADGPYRYVRNPLYLGTLLLAFAFALLASRAGFAVIEVGIFLLTFALISTEESGLLESQGKQYRDYLSTVPKLIPAFTARVPASGRRPNWASGIRSELYMWSFAAGAVAFAVTGRLRLFWGGCVLGVAVLVIEGFSATHKKQNTGERS